MRKRWLADLLAGCAAVAALLVWAGGAADNGRAAPARSAPQATGNAAPRAAPEEPAAAPGRAAASAEAVLPAHGASVGKGRVRVEGRPVVTGAGGGERREREDATFTLIAAGETRDVEVVGGQWTAEVPANAMLVFRSVRLRWRATIWHTSKATAIPGRPVVITATFANGTEVAVVDAGTGAAVDGVDVVLCENPARGGDIHPAGWPQREVLAGAPSRFELSGGGPAVYWMRAPGYAWTHVGIRQGTERQHVVELIRGGSLEIEVPGYEPMYGTTLGFHVLPSGIATPLATETRELLPGVHEITLEVPPR